jgi:ABC-type oligopeptide transport system ATPase subunit
MSENLLDVRELKKYYPVTGGVFRRHVADVKALDGVDLTIRKGECLGLVGESGCGKTTLGKTILRLHKATAGRIYFGQKPEEIEKVERMLQSTDAQERVLAHRMLSGMDLVRVRGRTLLRMRQRIQIVFQDPTSSLDPRMLVRDIVAEP